MLALSLISLGSCVHDAAATREDRAARPILVWETVEMVGKHTVMAFYPDGRIFLGRDGGGYDLVHLSQSEREAMFPQSRVNELVEGPNVNVFPDVTDLAFDVLMAWHESEVKVRSLYGAGDWTSVNEHPAGARARWLRPAADPEALELIAPFERLEADVNALRAKARPWKSGNFTLVLDYIPDQDRPAHPWPADLPDRDLPSCDPGSTTRSHADGPPRIVLEDRWLDRVRNELTTQNPVRVKGCVYLTRIDQKLPGEAAWRAAR